MLKSRLCLLLTAFIWGSTFIAQRYATDTIGPFYFNAIRFFVGALTLVPVMYFFEDTKPTQKANFNIFVAGGIIGFCLFAGAILQQISIAYTAVGKTAFITVLYIALVPLIGLFFNHRLSYPAIVGIIASIIGIGLLTLKDDLQIEWADLLLIISTLFWTAHILTMDYVSARFPCIRLAACQFLMAGILNAFCALFYENINLMMIIDSIAPILYSGVLSCGVGFTLQTVFQRVVPPTQVSLILSTETVFATLLGWLLLNEIMNMREIAGVIMMSIGVILAQLPVSNRYSIAPIQLFKRS